MKIGLRSKWYVPSYVQYIELLWKSESLHSATNNFPSGTLWSLHLQKKKVGADNKDQGPINHPCMERYCCPMSMLTTLISGRQRCKHFSLKCFNTCPWCLTAQPFVWRCVTKVLELCRNVILRHVLKKQKLRKLLSFTIFVRDKLKCM